MNDLDDQRCISAVLTGDVDAYSALVKRYEKPIFNLMYRMTGSRADALDLAQDAFIKAYEQLDKFQRDRRFFPWLYTIALNLAKNLLRKSTRGSQTSYVDAWAECSGLDYPQQQEEFMCARMDAHGVYLALLQLPTEQREAVILRYREELTMEEIAAALEISISGAKMRVHRGLHRLREILTAKPTHGQEVYPVEGCYAKNTGR
ncbi:RNA polymerase sigma factor [Desulfoferrobacter suflitae]|uniref:RNA polymerase sigma factor n=1 Tax=Desulfoferrobacter suflitae TaxID=2865782 RepID=UPI0021647FA8|nr:RNA polymerase sigma factor [Desulfoferrobacter suflitae]MCK8602111.1 RNA polymerase sigma factor [Desulfoferrobacter suflitae]